MSYYDETPVNLDEIKQEATLNETFIVNPTDAVVDQYSALFDGYEKEIKRSETFEVVNDRTKSSFYRLLDKAFGEHNVYNIKFQNLEPPPNNFIDDPKPKVKSPSAQHYLVSKLLRVHTEKYESIKDNYRLNVYSHTILYNYHAAEIEIQNSMLGDAVNVLTIMQTTQELSNLETHLTFISKSKFIDFIDAMDILFKIFKKIKLFQLFRGRITGIQTIEEKMINQLAIFSGLVKQDFD